MPIEPIILTVFELTLAIILVSLVMKLLKQPHVITYILVGVLLGPAVLGLISDPKILTDIGIIGIVLLMFFVGMEISLPKFVSDWKIVVIGPIIMTLLSNIIIIAIGTHLGWSIGKSVLIAFVISMSSTAVILKLLKGWHELHTKVGQNVLGILIIQDILVIPMILALNFLGSKEISLASTAIRIAIGVIVIGVSIFILKKWVFNSKIIQKIRREHEMYTFASLLLCFGFAIVTSFFGLSSAFGALIAGILVSQGGREKAVKAVLEPFYFLFVALFFISIGLLLDINYISAHITLLIGLVLIVFALSTLINMIMLRLLGVSWKEGFYAGALLSHLGEFGFVLATVGLENGIIDTQGYALILALVSLTLIFSPAWITILKKSAHIDSRNLEVSKGLTHENIAHIYSGKIEDEHGKVHDLSNMSDKEKKESIDKLLNTKQN